MLLVGKPEEEKTFEERKAELIMAKRLRMGTAVMLNKSTPAREMAPSMYLPNGNQVNSSTVSHKKKTKMTVIVDGKKQNKEQETKINVAAVKAASNPIALRYWQMCNQTSQAQPQQPTNSGPDNQIPSRTTCNTNQQPSSFPNYRITDQSCPPTFRMRDDSQSKTINNNLDNDILPPWMQPGFDSPPITKKTPSKQSFHVKVKTKESRWNPPGVVASKKLPSFEETNRQQMVTPHSKAPSQLPEDAENSHKLLGFSVQNKKNGHSTNQHNSQNLNQQQLLQILEDSTDLNNFVKLPHKVIQTSSSATPPPPPQVIIKHQNQHQHQQENEQRSQERQSRAPRRPPPPNFHHKEQKATFRRSKNVFIPHPSNCTPSPEIGRPARPQSPKIQITYENSRTSQPETPEIKRIPRPWSPPAYTHNVPWMTSNRERSSSLPPWVKQEKDPFWMRTQQLIKTNGN